MWLQQRVDPSAAGVLRREFFGTGSRQAPGPATRITSHSRRRHLRRPTWRTPSEQLAFDEGPAAADDPAWIFTKCETGGDVAAGVMLVKTRHPKVV
jgi:hypothetical protein